MKWVTRERPKIDRIACPWLIARFIDKEPEFLYVPNTEVLDTARQTGAVPYDVPGVEMTHVDGLCSFDAFLSKYDLTDPALEQSTAWSCTTPCTPGAKVAVQTRTTGLP